MMYSNKLNSFFIFISEIILLYFDSVIESWLILEIKWLEDVRLLVKDL